jgi:RNA polymerase sigma factor (sigma-70 family)
MTAIVATTPRDTAGADNSRKPDRTAPSHARTVTKAVKSQPLCRFAGGNCYRGRCENNWGTARVSLLGEFAETLEAARSGDEDALERLYRDTAPLVLGYARANGAREPEDVAQDVFVAMVTRLGSFVGNERAFRSWLLTITHRRLVDEIRRRSRRPVAEIEEQELLDRPAPGTAEDQALARLRAGGVLDAIDRLTPNQRSVLLLRMLADLPIAEIAEIVGKPESAVKALLRRALASLDRKLGTEVVEVDEDG